MANYFVAISDDISFDGGGTTEISAGSMAEAEKAAEQWAMDGDWTEAEPEAFATVRIALGGRDAMLAAMRPPFGDADAYRELRVTIS